MLASIPWRGIVWVIAGLVCLYFLGWEIFGPPRKARNLLMNGIGGLATAWIFTLISGFFGLQTQINLAMMACSLALGIPGAAFIGVLQWVLR